MLYPISYYKFITTLNYTARYFKQANLNQFFLFFNYLNPYFFLYFKKVFIIFLTYELVYNQKYLNFLYKFKILL